jgi:tetratricopeptide (TPR) repeat protein
VKLFRNLPGLRFEGRIHEQIIPAIRRMGGDVEWSECFVVHAGYDRSPEGQKRKRERDLRILHLEHSERPNHPFTLFNLGMTYSDFGESEAAVNFLRQCIVHSSDGESHLRKAYSILIYAYQHLGRGDEAWDTCVEGIRRFPDDSELRFRRAMLLHDRGQLQEAAEQYLDVLAHREDRHFTSLSRGITGFRTRQNLAALYQQMGKLVEAEAQWRLVLEEMPRYRVGWRELGELLIRDRRFEEVSALAEQLVADPELRVEGLSLRARMAASKGDKKRAVALWQEAVEAAPKDPMPLRALCQLLFELRNALAAEELLLRLLQIDSQDASSYHNLGSVYLESGRFEEAIDAYEHALKLRPQAAHTYVQLGAALRKARRLEEALASFESASQLAPQDAAILEAVQDTRALIAASRFERSGSECPG